MAGGGFKESGEGGRKGATWAEWSRHCSPTINNSLTLFSFMHPLGNVYFQTVLYTLYLIYMTHLLKEAINTPI